MKTSEFKKKVVELGYTVVDTGVTYEVYNNALVCAVIFKENNRVSLFSECFANDNLLKICVEYAQTPLTDREEEKKFYLQKMKSFYDESYREDYTFLNFKPEGNYFRLNSTYETDKFKTQFTQKEIDKIKEEQHTDLSEFKQIPVESVIIYERNSCFLE